MGSMTPSRRTTSDTMVKPVHRRAERQQSDAKPTTMNDVRVSINGSNAKVRRLREDDVEAKKERTGR